MPPITKPKWELERLLDNREHDLFSSVISEFNDIAGFKIEYYPFDDENSGGDYLFGEYKENKYYGPYKTKIIYEPPDELNPMDQFGIFSDETIEFAYIAQNIFKRDISIPLGNNTKPPVAGDIIITLWDGKKYEITDVGKGGKFNSRMFSWEIILKPLRYTEQSEQIDTIYNRDPFDLGEENKPLSDFGENEDIKEESNTIYDYNTDDDTDSSIYGH